MGDERPQLQVSFTGYSQLMMWIMLPILLLLVKAPALISFLFSVIVFFFTVATVSEWGLKTIHAGYALLIACVLLVLCYLNFSSPVLAASLTNLILLLVVVNAVITIALAQGVKKFFSGGS